MEEVKTAKEILEYIDSVCNLDAVDDYQELVEVIADIIKQNQSTKLE